MLEEVGGCMVEEAVAMDMYMYTTCVCILIPKSLPTTAIYDSTKAEIAPFPGRFPGSQTQTLQLWRLGKPGITSHVSDIKSRRP